MRTTWEALIPSSLFLILFSLFICSFNSTEQDRMKFFIFSLFFFSFSLSLHSIDGFFFFTYEYHFSIDTANDVAFIFLSLLCLVLSLSARLKNTQSLDDFLFFFNDYRSTSTSKYSAQRRRCLRSRIYSSKRRFASYWYPVEWSTRSSKVNDDESFHSIRISLICFSPLNIQVLPTFEPQKVLVDGPGITNGVPASLETSFRIDTREAGVEHPDVLIKVNR